MQVKLKGSRRKLTDKSDARLGAVVVLRSLYKSNKIVLKNNGWNILEQRCSLSLPKTGKVPMNSISDSCF